MKLVQKLLERLPGRFMPLERYLLDAVASVMDSEVRRLFQSKIDAVNKVQRLGQGREVNLYRMRGGKPFNSPAIRFPDDRREVALARVWFHIPGEEIGRRATLYAVNGFVFSLGFDPPAASVQRRTDAAIVRTELLSNPMHERKSLPIASLDDHSNLSEKLKRWHEARGADDFHWPLTTESRKVRIQEIPAQLPADYLLMTEETEGLVLGSWTIYGLADVYGIALDDAEYQLIAELRDRGVLAVENGRSDLYFLPFDGSTPEPVSAYVEEIERRLPVDRHS